MRYLAKYRLFPTKAELNKAICKQVYKNNFSLTKSARLVFDIVAKHSIKFGAAHLKAETIAKKIGKSIKTARRAVKLLTSLGMIEKVETTRQKSGGDGANIFRVLPVKTQNDQAKMTTRPVAENPCPVKDEAPKTESEASNSLSYKKDLNTNTYQEQKPVSFYGKFKSFIGSKIEADQKLVSRLFSVYRGQSAILLREGFSQEEIEKTAMDALKVATFATKNKRINNLAGYFNGVLKRKLVVEDPPKEANTIPATINKKRVIREERLPSWFTAPVQEKPVDYDAAFEADRAALLAELTARKA